MSRRFNPFAGEAPAGVTFLEVPIDSTTPLPLWERDRVRGTTPSPIKGEGIVEAKIIAG